MDMEITCKKCGHTWQSRIKNPVACPNCKRYGHQEGMRAQEGIKYDPNKANQSKEETESLYRKCCYAEPQCKNKAFLNVEGYRYCLTHWAEQYESTKDEYSDGPMLLPEFMKLTTIY